MRQGEKKSRSNITLSLAPEDESDWRMFRAQCLMRGLTASDLVRDFIKTSLQKWEREDKKVK